MRPRFDLEHDWTGKGASLREELEASYRQTKRMPERLKVPPIPAAFDRAMRLWQDLNSGRSMGGFGVAPFSWQDFDAFCRMTGERLSRDDIDAVHAIDAEFFASQAAAEKWRGRAVQKRA